MQYDVAFGDSSEILEIFPAHEKITVECVYKIDTKVKMKLLRFFSTQIKIKSNEKLLGQMEGKLIGVFSSGMPSCKNRKTNSSKS